MGDVAEHRPAARPRVGRNRAVRAPRALPAGEGARDVRALIRARTCGLSPTPQTKLTVGAPDDAYEREADAVADRVMTMSDAEAETSHRQRVQETIRRKSGDGAIRRQAGEGADGGGGADPETTEEWPELEPGEAEALPDVQLKAVAPDPEADPDLAARIRARSGGRPLSPGIRRFMERRIGYDFSQVRVHDDVADRRDARALQARAFTYGAHVWMGPGESAEDKRLMAHELTHVVQQGGARAGEDSAPRSETPEPQRKPLAVSGEPRGVRRLFGLSKDEILDKVAGWADDVPGWHLVTVLIGKNPITGKRVERNATNLVRGFMSLIPGGDRLFKQIEESGALQEAFDWIGDQVRKLNITWNGVKALFARAWDALSLGDITSPFKAFNKKIKPIFMPTLNRLWDFAKAVGKKVLEFIFKGALKLAGPLAKKVFTVFNKGKAVLGKIVADPVQFIKNLIEAAVGGFKQFAANIWEHLKKGLIGWLVGALGNAGIEMPDTFDFKGILSIVFQILGLTYQNLRKRLVKRLGEKRVGRIEKAVEFIRLLVTKGLAAAWRKIMETLGNLKDMVIEGIRNFIVTKIVQAALTKLVSLFNPVGAVIQAIIAIYNVIAFFIERIQQIADVVMSVFNSIEAIADGRLKSAKDFVEQAIGRTVPVVIAFLARLIGLGGVADKIRDIIKKIRKRVNKALDKVEAFILKKAKKLFGMAKNAAGKLVAWWKAKAEMTKPEKHAIQIKGGGKGYQVWIQSDLQPFDKFIAEHGVNSRAGADGKPKVDSNESRAAEQCAKQIGDKPPASPGAAAAPGQDREAKLAQLYGAVMEHYAAAKTQVANASKAKRDAKKGGDTAAAQAYAATETKLKALRDALKQYLEALKAKSAYNDTLNRESTPTRADGSEDVTQEKQTSVIRYGPLQSGTDMATWAIAEPLTIAGPKGSTPDGKGRTWQTVKSRKKGGGTFYIQGHMINDHLHGPGNELRNLTVLSADANKAHNLDVEEKVKDQVWNRLNTLQQAQKAERDRRAAAVNPCQAAADRGRSDAAGGGGGVVAAGKAVRYEVRADYAVSPQCPGGGNARRKIAELLARDDIQSDPEKVKLLETENKIAGRLVCKADIIDLIPKNGGGFEHKPSESIPLGNDGVVINHTPCTPPGDVAVEVETIYISGMSVADAAAHVEQRRQGGKPMNDEAAKLLQALPAILKSGTDTGRITTWKALQTLVDAADSVSAAQKSAFGKLQSDTFVLLYTRRE